MSTILSRNTKPLGLEEDKKIKELKMQPAIKKESTEGVVWASRPNGLVAVKVARDSPAYLSGIKEGDILFKINGNPVRNRADRVEQRHEPGLFLPVIAPSGCRAEIICYNSRLVYE